MIILFALLLVGNAHARSYDYWGNYSTPAEARRYDMHRFHCIVHAERVQREIMRGRWWGGSTGC